MVLVKLGDSMQTNENKSVFITLDVTKDKVGNRLELFGAGKDVQNRIPVQALRPTANGNS